MSEITPDLVRHLAHLARIGLTDDEVQRLTGELGVIVDAEGRGADARVQVNFRESGLKWLALEYAKLEPV